MAVLEVDKKINLLALTSFILSTLALLAQVHAYLKNAQMELHPPQVLILRVVTFAEFPAELFIQLEAPITYTNLGAVGYSGIVANEKLRLTVAQRDREFRAIGHFVDVDDSKTSRSQAPSYRGEEMAGPKVVAAQGAITHWVRFGPRNIVCTPTSPSSCDPRANSLPLDATLRAALKLGSRLVLTFSADVVGGNESLVASCWINSQYLDLDLLEKQAFGVLDCNLMTAL